MGQRLYCSAADAGVLGERLWCWLHPLCWTQWHRLASLATGLSSTVISPTGSFLTSPRPLSPQSTAALTLGSLHNPQTPAPSRCPFQGTSVPVWGICGGSKDCLILILFRLPEISCFTLSLKWFSTASNNCPDMGIRPLLQFPHLSRAGPVLLTLLFFPLVPSSYQQTWLYIFLSTGQVLLFTLKGCSACTSASEGVLLMYPWREMYSRSTYPSAVLFSPLTYILKNISLDLQALHGPLGTQESHVPSEFLPKVCQNNQSVSSQDVSSCA